MAEGGDFENENFKTDYLIDLDDDDDTTPILQPVNAGELQTMMHEKRGLEDISYEETPPFNSLLKSSWEALISLFPEARSEDLRTSYSNRGQLLVRQYKISKKFYPLFTKDTQTGKDILNPKFTKEIKYSWEKR